MSECEHPGFWSLRVMEVEPTVVVELSCYLCGEKMSISSEHATLILQTGDIVTNE